LRKLYRFGAACFLSLFLILPACTPKAPAQKTATEKTLASPPLESAAIPASTQTETMMEAFRGLAPPSGLELAPLFADPLPTEDRVTRLEGVVQKMHDNFDTIMPEMVRLVGFEKDMRELVGILKNMSDKGPRLDGAPQAPDHEMTEAEAEALAAANRSASGATSHWNTGPAPADMQQQPAPAAQQPQPSAPVVLHDAPPAQQQAAAPEEIPAASGAVEGIRFGNYPDKTRVVLDMTAKAGMTADLQGDGKTLVISLPGMSWPDKKSGKPGGKGLVSGYRIEGDLLYIDLKYASSIKSQTILAPNAGNAHYRAVIDLSN
jgi:hypothetical protein